MEDLNLPSSLLNVAVKDHRYDYEKIFFRKDQSNSYLFLSFLLSPVLLLPDGYEPACACQKHALMLLNTFKVHFVRGVACSSAAWAVVSVFRHLECSLLVICRHLGDF